VSKTKAWLILAVFAAFLLWGLAVGISKFGIAKIASDIGLFVGIILLVFAGFLALGFTVFFVKERVDRFYKANIRPKPWVKPFVVSQLGEAELYDALKSRLEMVERNDELRYEIFDDRETGQRWQNQYVEQGFGSWYEFRPQQPES